MDPFTLVPAKGNPVPVVLSVPHCGVAFPPEVAAQLKPSCVEDPEDTDWFVHQLYDFAPQLGVTMIRARYSRYVIDLNRNPDMKPLYQDGRKETALVPETNFNGELLYIDARPNRAEIGRRRELYYDPYHQKLQSIVADLKKEFRAVLVYDAHSIRRFIPTIRPEPFPDLILGDGSGTTADIRLRDAALKALAPHKAFQVSVNDPFQGGYLTRRFGQPKTGIHALQLEMSQDIYLDEHGGMDRVKTKRLKEALKPTLEALIAAVGTLR